MGLKEPEFLEHAHDAAGRFVELDVLRRLKRHLPAQGPLKDFIHHNTLHAFQDGSFREALHEAVQLFGYRTTLAVEEYRRLHREGRIREETLQRVVLERKGAEDASRWLQRMFHHRYDGHIDARIGSLRAHWKRDRRIDMDARVHTTLFRVLNSYLDQGVAIWRFPVWDRGFLAALRELQRGSMVGLITGARAKALFMDEGTSIRDLLDRLVGEEALYEQYLFDQQFAHSGWSGLVAVIEEQPASLLDRRSITLREVVIFELLLELDALDNAFPDGWRPLVEGMRHRPVPLFAPLPANEQAEVCMLWQESFEWSYYDEVLAALTQHDPEPYSAQHTMAQGLFCIDDRSCSLRRHLEREEPGFRTFGTPGHFGLDLYYRPQHGRSNTRICPATVTPRHLVKEVDGRPGHVRDLHFSRHSHGLVGGWVTTQTLGFWAALRLFISLFRPSGTPGTSDAFKHTDHLAKLTVENQDPDHREDGLQVGFTLPEMTTRVESLLRSIGLVKDFAPVVYVIGHGASSVNNPHYAAYDCGACGGRPGSVNARVMAHMANHPGVRAGLQEKGIVIPGTTRFVAGLQDTTRDEVKFFDTGNLQGEARLSHDHIEQVFLRALRCNAVERARRFDTVDSSLTPERVHEQVRLRSVSLFVPRPELNHATNALMIVGRRRLSRGLFLDRRAFLNSYDPTLDADGTLLTDILAAATPVCGGINLEYYFSRMDNQKLGAGTKLPHNVMGLIGVANGIEGDLRPGLPSQMIEVHDPVRLLMVVEQTPEVVLKAIQRVDSTFEWFINEWVRLVAVHPGTRDLFLFRDGGFRPYRPPPIEVPHSTDPLARPGRSTENMPVTILEKA